MPRLLVLNSFGPMGSTLLAGLLEKLGYGNTPVRKLGLHAYLTGQVALETGIMQARLRETINSHAKPGLRGGVSVLDRGDQLPKSLTDPNRVMRSLAALEAGSFRSVEDLYMACRRVYDESVIYKTPESHPDWQIELTVDIHRYDPQTIYRSYLEGFETVHMIHLHRDFRGWINSLASQAFVHPDLFNRIRFFPHLRYADYSLYEKSVASIPGLDLSFDELFDTPIEDLIRRIADFTGLDTPKTEWRQESYDLYGKIVPYQKAFTRFDDSVHYLSSSTLEDFENRANTGGFARPIDRFKCWGYYLKDMVRYRAARASR